MGRVNDFFSNVENASWFLEVFDNLPDTLFYVKDQNFRWVTCNNSSLRFLNFTSKEEIYGAVEQDFFPKVIADGIRKDDTSVIRNNRKITNRAELVVDKTGLLTWVSTNKKPLIDRHGRVIGLVGTTQILHKLDDLSEEYQPFKKVMSYIIENIDKPVIVEQLAPIMQLSSSQFRKRFKSIFRLSPQEFILRTRLQRSARLLSETDQPLVKIAAQCGYCDQSYFTKQFHLFFGTTPKRYRQMWRKT